MDDTIKNIEPLDGNTKETFVCPCPFVRKYFNLDGQSESVIGDDSRFQNFKISDLIDNNDVMIKFNISAKTLLNWRKSGKIPFSRFGRKIIYNIYDIKKLLADGFVESKKMRKP